MEILPALVVDHTRTPVPSIVPPNPRIIQYETKVKLQELPLEQLQDVGFICH